MLINGKAIDLEAIIEKEESQIKGVFSLELIEKLDNCIDETDISRCDTLFEVVETIKARLISVVEDFDGDYSSIGVSDGN